MIISLTLVTVVYLLTNVAYLGTGLKPVYNKFHKIQNFLFSSMQNDE